MRRVFNLPRYLPRSRPALQAYGQRALPLSCKRSSVALAIDHNAIKRVIRHIYKKLDNLTDFAIIKTGVVGEKDNIPKPLSEISICRR